jgi:hypothetical protein
MEPKEREKFELEYAKEFEAYEEENKPKSFWTRFKDQPIRHLVLFSYIIMSIKRTQTWLQPYDWYKSTLAGLIGIFMADFITGFIHLYCDTTPLEPVTLKKRSFLQWSSYGFHYHHANMQNWNENDIWYGSVIRAGFSFYGPVMTLCFIIDYFDRLNGLVLFSICVTSHLALVTQFSHAAAHGRWSDHPIFNPLIRTMQRFRLILPPSVHRDHHKHFVSLLHMHSLWRPHTNESSSSNSQDRNFAILTGWSTHILNLIFHLFFANRLDKGVEPEEQRRVYYERKDQLVWPYYHIFPKWRESVRF